MPEHNTITGDSNHAVNHATYATQAAMWAASVVSADIDKVARVTDDGSFWRLDATTPIWLPLSGVARCVFDATAGKTQTAHSLSVVIPDNAIITRAWYDVTTTFTSASDAATIAIHANAANDIVSALAISAGGNIWDAGLHEGIEDGTVSTAIKMTANRTVTATVAGGEDLTAGVLYLYLSYVLSE